MIPTMQFLARGDTTVTIRPDTDNEVLVVTSYHLNGSTGNAARIQLTDGTDTDVIQTTNGVQHQAVQVVATRDRYVEILANAADDFALAAVARVRIGSNLT